MSLIPPQRRVEREGFAVKLEVPVLDALKHYCEYINSTQEHTVNEALRLLFRTDQGFIAWRQEHYPDARSPEADEKAIAGHASGKLTSRSTSRSTNRATTEGRSEPTPDTPAK
jgi:hypothetical protein